MLHTSTTISIEDKQFRQFHSLHLEQRLQGHHQFELIIGYDWLQEAGSGMAGATRALLGKEVSITVDPLEAGPDYKPLVFNGIIMSVSSGKESDGMHGYCVIRGYSPTILLAGDPHTQSFEKQSLAAIVNGTLKAAGPYLSRLQVGPEGNDELKYIVQYKETAFDFLQRLSLRFGEWFFYNGQQLVFGKYEPRKIPLLHLVNLMSFDLELKVQSNNQLVNGYDYRKPQVVQNTTTAQPSGKLNNYTQQVQSLSEKLFSKTTVHKAVHAFTSNARAELEKMLARQKMERMAGMVELSGRSTHTSLRIGDHVSVQESVYGKEDHGEFMITTLIHHLSGNGDYYNHFDGIPADAAVPLQAVADRPYSEAQSAVVVDNHDPKDLGRVRVRFRWQQQEMSPWVRIVAPHGGGGKGLYMVPEKGEEVVVSFEGGNPELPFVLGTAYNGEGKSGFGSAGNDIKAIKTRSGISIIFNDAEGSLTITDPSGNQVKMDGKKNMTLHAPTKLEITSKEISISAETISVASTKGASVAGKTLSLTGEDSVSVGSKAVGINGSSSMTLDTPDLKSTGKSTSISGNSINVNGSTLSLSGSGDVTVSGALVKINS